MANESLAPLHRLSLYPTGRSLSGTGGGIEGAETAVAPGGWELLRRTVIALAPVTQLIGES